MPAPSPGIPAEIPADEWQRVVVSTLPDAHLNLRTGPGLAYYILAKLRVGDHVLVEPDRAQPFVAVYGEPYLWRRYRTDAGTYWGAANLSGVEFTPLTQSTPTDIQQILKRVETLEKMVGVLNEQITAVDKRVDALNGVYVFTEAQMRGIVGALDSIMMVLRGSYDRAS